MVAAGGASAAPHERPVELLQRLIRFDTSNPPGNEAACIGYVGELLSQAGLSATVLARDPARPNLISRLAGRGTAPPLLLYGHVDVVPAEPQTWRHPPFAGTIADGYVWGRGALDMKGGVAMMLAAFLRAKAEGLAPAGDVVLALLSDEEAFGDHGAKYLVESHPALFAGIRYAIGEFGGFTFHVRGKRFYPIMVAEKQLCLVRATLRGPGGHAAQPVRGAAMAKLGRMLGVLDRRRLPVHVSPVVRDMVLAMSRALPLPAGLLLRQLLRPRLTDRVLDLLGATGARFDPLLHNTASATVVRAGSKVNVIPSEATAELDCRLLPGQAPPDLLAELGALLGPDVHLELIRHDPGPMRHDLGLFPTLAAILREADPAGTPVPLLLSAVTDARYFARLGIQTYGFLPMPLPPEFDFVATIHGADERVPTAAIEFGAHALYKLLQSFK